MPGVTSGLRLLCVTAHPDDETLGFGGTLAHYAAGGVETHLVTATRGEPGRYGDARIGDGSGRHPGPEALARVRERELRAAAVAAADPSVPGEGAPHRVAKLYYMAWTPDVWDAYQAAFKRLVSEVDGEERVANPWPRWSISAEIDTSEQWPAVWGAVQCHESQTAVFERLAELDEEHHRALWGRQQFYRAFSTVNGGRDRESDLFEGLR